MCDSPQTGCTWRTTPIYMRNEQAEIKWARRGISIVAYCCSVKLCARAFQSKQSGAVTSRESGARCNLHKKNVGSVQFIAKRRGCGCNLSVGVALKVRFTMNRMCAKSNTQIYMARTSNSRVISSGDLCCCLLLQCEDLRTCCSSFSIATQEISFLVFRMSKPNTWTWPEMNMYLD